MSSIPMAKLVSPETKVRDSGVWQSFSFFGKYVWHEVNKEEVISVKL